MSADNTVALRVDGRDFSGWKSVQVTRGLEQVASSFVLQSRPAFPGDDNPVQIRPGSACEILIGDDTVLTGYVDDVSPRYDKKQHVLSVTGRSKVADLVDCSATAEPGQWRNQTLAQIARALAATYSVEVVAAADPAAVIPRVVAQTGESVVAVLERAARLRAVILTDDAQGRLVLTQAGTDEASDALEQPGNILAGAGRFSAADLYTDYVCKGQHVGSDEVYAESAAAPFGEASDTTLSRTRTLVLPAEQGADIDRCKTRATWEAATRAGKASGAVYTVAGWRQRDGSLWEHNRLVRVKDSLLAIDGTLLIVSVTLSIGDTGAYASLAVAPAAGYQPLPPQKPRPRGSKTKTATDGVGIWSDLEAYGQVTESA